MKFSDQEGAFYHTFLLLVKKVTALGALPQNQRKCAQYDRFSGTGFTGQDIQTRIKADLKVIY